MNILSGFNSQEIRRLHPYLSSLLRRVKALEAGAGRGTGTARIDYGGDTDIQPTGNSNIGGALSKVARADHQHLFKFPVSIPLSTPDGASYFDLSASAIKVYVGGSPTTKVVAGATTADVKKTGVADTGTAPRYAFADHSHPTALLPQSNAQTPVVDEIRYDTNNKIVRWDGSAWVPLSVETVAVDGGTTADVQPTKLKSAGTSTRFSHADHSHPTAILPQSDSQTPVVDEIRYNSSNKLVRWDGSNWVQVSVETVDAGVAGDVQPTKLKSEGSSSRFSRADHSHPTAILPQSDSQTPVVDEIRYNSSDKLVRWNGSSWVQLSVEAIDAGLASDVQPTKLKSAGTSSRYARADHSHPTAILPQSDSQTPVADEIRYTGTNQLVRWNGTSWVAFSSSLPVPADPLILPYDNQVSSPQNRQLVNLSSWDNIGNATLAYYDSNSSAYRLAFARPLVVAISSTPSGKDVWANKANELVLKYSTSDPSGAGGVLWSRGGNTTTWSPVLIQLVDSATSAPTPDVGVLARSALTGTTGSRRWFIRGRQEDAFRAPFVGFATYTASTTPATTDLSTSLGDGYGYFIYDYDRVDIVRPITDGNKYPTMLSHYIISPPCRIFSTATNSSGHYVADEFWNNIWVIGFFTTTSATTDLTATLPTITVPIGIREGRVLLYLHNPQTSAITTVFAVAVRTPTSSSISTTTTPNTTISIPANTIVIADLGFLSFPPSSTLSHIRSYPITIAIIRRKSAETSNANKVRCLGVVIVPQRAA